MGVNRFLLLHFFYLCISLETYVFWCGSFLIFSQKLINEGTCSLRLQWKFLSVHFRKQIWLRGGVNKQPPVVFYKKRCFQTFSKIHGKTSVVKSLVNKVVSLHACCTPRGVYLWILRHLQKHPFWKTSANRFFLTSIPDSTVDVSSSFHSILW